ncbi:MAG: hypothetical protein PVF28_00095 [Thioalkalispiraceae bacterium]|jgi:hypothetical protein
MISVGELTLFVVIQIIITLAILLIIFFLLWRNSRKQLIKCISDSNKRQKASPTASIENYLTTESKLTEGRFDLLYQDSDRQHTEIIEPDCLLLRKKYLELEKELLGNTEREDNFWANLSANLRRIIQDCYLVKRLKLKEIKEDAEEEINELKTIMEEQTEEFESLLAGLDSDSNVIEIAAVKDKLSTLSRSHKELSHCIAVLEDENQFLRNQIRGLLEV